MKQDSESKKNNMPSPTEFIIAILIPFIALGLQWLFWDYISPFVWFLFFPAVFISARIGGLMGGMFSTVISIMSVVYFFMPPQLSWEVKNPYHLFSVGMFLIMGYLFSDIQERFWVANQRTKEALKETRAANEKITQLNEENLRILFETMNEGIALNEIIYDENGEMVDYRILNVNKAFYSTADYRGANVIGNVATKLYGMSSEFIKNFWKQHKEKNSTVYTEMYSPLDNHCFFIATSPFINDRFVTSFFDITERKQAEEALRKSEEKYRTVANFTYDWETWRGPDGAYLYVSPACERITGHTVDEFLADPNLVIKMTHPDDLANVKKHFGESFNGSRSERLQLDFQIIIPGGEVRWIGHSCTAVFGENGQWLGRRESNRDITERKELQLNLETALIRERQLAYTDVLTGVNNRRHLYELAEHEFEIAERYQQPLAVIMFDIDHFKQVNDTFGHAAGDQILQQVTQVACAELRSVDVIGRYGGEEFVVVVPMTNAQQAHPLAERIRIGVEKLRVSTERGEAAVTLSIGIVEISHGAQNGSAEDLIRRADKAMYAAKQAGRNRTVIFGQE